jgi:hypothetical protein
MKFSNELSSLQEFFSNISWKVFLSFAIPLAGYSLLVMGLASFTLALLGALVKFPFVSILLIVVSPVFLILPLDALWLPIVVYVLGGFLFTQEFLLMEAVTIGVIFGLGGAFLWEKFRLAQKKLQVTTSIQILVVRRNSKEDLPTPFSVLRVLRPNLLKQDFPPTSGNTQAMVQVIQEVFGRFLEGNPVQELPTPSLKRFLSKEYLAISMSVSNPIRVGNGDEVFLFNPFITLPLEFDLKGLFEVKLYCLANSWDFDRDQFLLSGIQQFFNHEEFCNQVKGLILPKDENLFTFAIMAHTSPYLEKHQLALLSVEIVSWDADISVVL